jgi:hypothetical protein
MDLKPMNDMGVHHSKRNQSSYQMQCDIAPCLFWKTSLCNVFIEFTISFCNYIYLLMIFHKFKVISLSFESPFMHIKDLKCSHQIMLLDLNILFVHQMCTIHSQNLKGDSYWWLKVQKELRLIRKLFITHIYTFCSKVFVAPWITKIDDVSLTKVVRFYMVKGMDKFYGGKNIN